jgi:hypothetical protein
LRNCRRRRRLQGRATSRRALEDQSLDHPASLLIAFSATSNARTNRPPQLAASSFIFRASAPNRICLDRCPPPPSGNATGQNFVNAASIEIDDLETPTLAVKTFADVRQMTELTEHESCGRMIAAVRREGDGQPVGHFVSRGRPRSTTIHRRAARLRVLPNLHPFGKHQRSLPGCPRW